MKGDVGKNIKQVDFGAILLKTKVGWNYSTLKNLFFLVGAILLKTNSGMKVDFENVEIKTPVQYF